MRHSGRHLRWQLASRIGCSTWLIWWPCWLSLSQEKPRRRRSEEPVFCRARFVAAILLLSVSVACQSGPRYTVTATPINLIGPGHPGHCIAIDPTDPEGVWTWEPGLVGTTSRSSPNNGYSSDCSRRSTGPSVLRADQARVTATASGASEVHFQMQLIIGGPLDVSLILQDGVLRNPARGTHVATSHRSDLDVPDMPVR